MTSNRKVFLAVSLLFTLVLVLGSLWAAAARSTEPEEDSLYKYLSVFSEVLSLVRQAYVDPPELDRLMAGAFEGAADALDPFSVYVPPSEVDRFRAVREIGVERSGLLLLKERGLVYVAGVEPESPAAAAEIERGDLVSEIDGESTREMALWEIQDRLARDDGTEVGLDLVRRGEPVHTALVLGDYPVERVTVEEVDGVPVLRIRRFEAATPGAVSELLASLREGGRDRVLVDLRSVAGGSSEVAYQVGALFTAGKLGSLMSKSQELEAFSSEEEPLWRGEVAVLVDRGTLGAAEVLASVLRGRDGTSLIGEPTFGHAGRERLVELSSGALLQLTDAFYAGPDGVLLDSSLEPDVEVDERSRRLSEQDLSLDELILRRGVQELLEQDQTPEQREAA